MPTNHAARSSGSHKELWFFPTPPLKRVVWSVIGVTVCVLLLSWLGSMQRDRSPAQGASTEITVVMIIIGLCTALGAWMLLVHPRYVVRELAIRKQITVLGLMPVTNKGLLGLAGAELVPERYQVTKRYYIPGTGLIWIITLDRYRLWLWHESEKVLIAEDMADDRHFAQLLKLRDEDRKRRGLSH